MKFSYKVKLNGIYYPANTEIVLNESVKEIRTEKAVDNKPQGKRSKSKKESK